MKMTFTQKKKKFGAEALNVLRFALDVIDDYRSQGYKLSLRQLYYQLVSRNVVPNTEADYKRVGDIIADARINGLADWDMIEDRGRETVTPTHWDSPAEIIKTCARSYKVDKWADQPNFVEVMVEKQALEGVLEPVCRRNDVPFTANKGYSSVTMMFETGRRIRSEFLKRMAAAKLTKEIAIKDRFFIASQIKRLIEAGIIEADLSKDGKIPLLSLTEKAVAEGWPRIVILYLGDHDPSGIDMTRDVRERLSLFSDFTPIEVRRLALNMDQIDELNPPENPAKLTDSRSADYVARFGSSSWELDAVAPDQLADIVQRQIEGLKDAERWDKTVARETEERKTLEKIAAKL